MLCVVVVVEEVDILRPLALIEDILAVRAEAALVVKLTFNLPERPARQTQAVAAEVDPTMDFMAVAVAQALL
jgi:hypothetical protein